MSRLRDIRLQQDRWAGRLTMNRPARVLAVAPIVVGLGWLAIHSFEAGAAGTRVFEAGGAMRSLSAPRAPQPADRAALLVMRDELLHAHAVTPRDPAIHELLGLIDARGSVGPEGFAEASAHFMKALELRPTSPQ